MLNSTTPSATHPQNSEFPYHIKFYERSSGACEFQFIQETTSNCLFKISRAPEDVDYQIKNLSGAPVFLKEEQLQKDEERPVGIGDSIRFEIPQGHGQMESFRYVFWPMKRQEPGPGEELIDTEEDENKCAMCLKDLYRCVTVTPCSHRFCSSCLSKYLEKNLKNAVCPTCRTNIEGFKKKISGHKLSDMSDQEEKKRMDQGDFILKGAKLKRYEDNSVYFGFFKDNKKEGKGKFVDNQQNEYDGEWKDDKKEGQGECNYANGERYVGDWKDDKKNGSGEFQVLMGKYEGEFRDDKFEGQGEFDFTNGDRYEGGFKDGKLEGEGDYISGNGDVFKGSFKNNKKEGYGEYTHADGTKYRGEYKDGKREGQGEVIYPNGDKFFGKWKAGMKDGFGEMVWINGKKEVGVWKDDVFCGGAQVKPEETPKGDDVKTQVKKGFLSKIFPSRNNSKNT